MRERKRERKEGKKSERIDHERLYVGQCVCVHRLKFAIDEVRASICIYLHMYICIYIYKFIYIHKYMYVC